MSYDEFKDALLAELQDFYSNDAKIYYKEVLKTNGIKLDGINIVYDTEEKVNPVIYINGLYDRYANGELTFDEVVDQIIDIRDKSSAEPTIINVVSDITDWDKVSEYVYPFLINTESNRELLEDLVSRQFLDLSIIYVIRIRGEAQDMWASVKISRAILNRYGVDEDVLHEQAMLNLRDREDFQVRSLFEVLEDLACGDFVPSDDTVPNMYVLSNGTCNHGASQLLNIGKLGEEYADRSFFVIPSSIHEVILVDYEENMDPETINEMIRDVNATVLDATEILSDHVYLYDGNINELRMCA